MAEVIYQPPKLKIADGADTLLAKKKLELKLRREKSLEDRDGYWSNFAEKLTWTKQWDKVCDLSDAPITKWFAGGKLNACYNCVDRYVDNGQGDKDALYFDSPVTKTRKTYSFNQIHDEVARLAGLLEELGVGKGDLVMIYMPMTAEGAFAMLASCRIGAVHSCTPNGLPAQDLASRIDHFKPKVILVTSAGYHANGWLDYKGILDEALEKANHQPKAVLVWKRQDILKVTMLEGRDIDWKEAVKKAKPKLQCVPVEANEPFFVIYTSGSTGEPKGIVHSVGGICVKYTHDYLTMFENDDEVYLGTVNLGWIASHYFIYGCLLRNITLVLYEGDPLLTSDPNELYRVVRDNKVTRLAVRPGVLKLLRKMDPDGTVASSYDFQNLRQMYFGSEGLDRATGEWTTKVFETTLTNMYGQTETGCFMAATGDYAFAKNARRFLETVTPLPGFDVTIVKSVNTVAKSNEVGRILPKLPLPPGCIVSLKGDHEKCKTLYFSEYPGYFDTKDEGYLDEGGDLVIGSRVDDIMKHASVYLSAQAVEEIVMSHPDVAECVVISTPDVVLKEIPVTLYVVRNGAKNDNVTEEVLERLSKHFGEAVTFGKAISVTELPKTRTGKIHRSSVAALGKGKKPRATGGLENPEVLVEIEAALKKAGYDGCSD